jgi:hypothetical protein
VVEGVFGGMKTRLGGAYLWERKPWTAMVRTFLELIAYGLRVACPGRVKMYVWTYAVLKIPDKMGLR